MSGKFFPMSRSFMEVPEIAGGSLVVVRRGDLGGGRGLTAILGRRVLCATAPEEGEEVPEEGEEVKVPLSMRGIGSIAKVWGAKV